MLPRSRILLVALALLAAAPGWAGTTSWSGTDGATTYGSTAGTTIGMLMTPSNITFSDILASNTTSASVTTTDDWSFSIPTSVFGASVTGDQISLKNFTVSGVLDSVSLYSGTPGSGSLIATGAASGSFTSLVLTTLSTAGNYYLEVKATLGPGSVAAPTIGNYTGSLVATALPEPSTIGCMIAGMLAIGAVGWRRRR